MVSLAERGIDPSVVDDQTGRLTFTDDIARAIRHLLDNGAPYGTYNITGNGQPRTWAQIAARVFELTGHDPARVTPVTTAEYYAGKTGIAPRPANSVLDLTKIESIGYATADHDHSLSAYLGAERNTR